MQLQREYGSDADAVGRHCNSAHAAAPAAAGQQQRRFSRRSDEAEPQLPVGLGLDGSSKGGRGDRTATATATALDPVV